MMTENSFETQYDITKKNKLLQIYNTNKRIIISSVLLIIITVGSFNFYLKKEERKRILLAEDYIESKIFLLEDKKSEALNNLKNIIYANDSTYSTLSFFLILNQNLITDEQELLTFFDHVLKSNKFDSELKNLLIYKKLLFFSNSLDESEILQEVKPLINSDSLWKPHALILLGDYYVSKNQYLKAKEFYNKIILFKNLQKDLYEHAKFQLSYINNE
jgi:predicted negative regulator of RcsB-dependent stress response